MRTILFSIALSSIGLLFTPSKALAQTDPEASKFLNRLMGEGTRVAEKQLIASNAQMHTKDEKGQRAAQSQAVSQLKIAINNLKNMKDYKNSTLRQQHLNLYDALLKTYNNDYEKLFSLVKSSEESVETMEVYLQLQDDANNKVNALIDSSHTLEMIFAKEYGINLTFEENQASKKFTTAVKAVSAYRRKVYMEHFKIQKAYAPLIDDLNKNKGKQVEKFIAPLQKTCEAVILSLDKIGAYEGDTRLSKAVRDETDFFIAECKKNLPTIAKLMAKPQLESQEEAKTYNNWNKDFITKINKNSQKYAEEEGRIYDKHTPVYKPQSQK